MFGRTRHLSAMIAAGLIALGTVGCAPPEAGTIEAPPYDATLGPTTGPDAPLGDSVIPAAEDAGPAPGSG